MGTLSKLIDQKNEKQHNERPSHFRIFLNLIFIAM